MRIVDDSIIEELIGSTGEAYFQYNAWYDGNVTAENLPVSSYSHDFDITRQVIGQTNITVSDSLGTLNPWSIDDPLGVGGAFIQTQMVVGNQVLTLGYQRLTHCEPEEKWRLGHNGLSWVASGNSTPIEAQDSTVIVSGSRFMTQEAPPSGTTVMVELARILDGLVNITFDSNLVDKAVPTSIVYQDDRLAAMTDLAAAIGAEYRCDASGTINFYLPSTTPIYTIQGGNEGSLISVKRVMDIGDFPNAVVSQNTTSDGTALYGVATQNSGAGYWDGPHGRWPAFHQANFATNQTSINRDAATFLTNMQSSRTVTVSARIAFDIRLEVGDWVNLNCPILTEGTLTMPGRVMTISYQGNSGIPSAMDITMACSPDDARAISDAIIAAQLFGAM